MKESSKKFAADTAKDIIISVVIVAVIFLSLYAYTQNWPPLVVIESESMQHGSISHIGTADTGDIVLVKKVYSEDDVVTYVEGRMKNYHTYGDYGNVIIYNYNGQSIIHRAIVYLKWSGSRWVIRGFENGNYPSWLEVTRNEIIIKDVGYAHKSIIIHTDPKDLDPEKVGYEGFITMGDHNLAKYGSYAYDQNSVDFVPICPKLVNYNMIEGVAVGEIPWFGAIKLYVTGTNTNEIPENTKVNLAVSIIGIIALTFIADYLIEHRKSILERFRKRENSEEANDDFKEEKKPPLEDLEK